MPTLGAIALAASVVGGIYIAIIIRFGLDRETRRLYVSQLRGAILTMQEVFGRRAPSLHASATE
jgi:hypothetical protein